MGYVQFFKGGAPHSFTNVSDKVVTLMEVFVRPGATAGARDMEGP
jgi:hypothetical protein